MKKFKKEQWETDASTYIVSLLRPSFLHFFNKYLWSVCCVLSIVRYISEEETGLVF